MERALPLLTSTQTIRFAVMTGAKDPDDLLRQSGKSAMDLILKQSKPMVDAIWETTLSGRALRTPEDRGAFIAAIKKRVNQIQNESLRHLYLEEIQKRVSETFDWRTHTQKTHQKFSPSAKTFKKPWPSPEPLVNRKQPMNAQTLREKALLAILINHPALFDEFSEDITRINFTTPVYETLRQTLIDALSQDIALTDSAELQRYFVDTSPGLASLLTELLSEATYVHAAYARPDRSLEQARQGWKSIWNKYLKELLQIDLQNASRRYAEDNTAESLTRLMALRSQLEYLTQQEGEDRPESL